MNCCASLRGQPYDEGKVHFWEYIKSKTMLRNTASRYWGLDWFLTKVLKLYLGLITVNNHTKSTFMCSFRYRI